MIDERDTTLIYFAAGNSNTRTLLLGNFSPQDISSYSKHFGNLKHTSFKQIVENSNSEIIEESLINEQWELVFISATWFDFKKYSKEIEIFIKKSQFLEMVLIKLRFENYSFLNYSRAEQLAKKNNAKLYFPLPSFDKFKLILPISDATSTLAGLQLYNPVSNFQIIRNTLLKLFIRLGVLKYFLKDLLIVSQHSKKMPGILNSLAEKSGNLPKEFVLHNASAGTGTKALIAGIDKENKIHNFMKVSNDPIRKSLIKNEFNIIKALNQKNISCGTNADEIDLKEFNSYLAVYYSKFNPKLKPSGSKITEKHLIFLAELFNKTKTNEFYLNSFPYKEVQRRTNRYFEGENHKILSLALQNINDKLNDKIRIGLAHRDFVAWNIKYDNGKLFVYDWEWAAPSLPLYDLLHFIVHGKLHLEKKSINDTVFLILKDAQYLSLFKRFSEMINENSRILKTCVLYYLIDRITFEAELAQDNKIDKNYLTCIQKLLLNFA